MRRSLYAIILAFVVVPYAVIGQELKSAWDGAQLRVLAPGLHVLAGRAAERLRDGNTVSFDFQLSLQTPAGLLRRSLERFVFSYDLWEERYSVARLARDRFQRQQASNLTQAAAEAWCLENLVVPTEGLKPDQNLTVHLEVRGEDPRAGAVFSGDPGVSLTALIELFSRPAKPQQARWNLQHGPLRLLDLKTK